MARKHSTVEQVVRKLTRRHVPGVILDALANICEEYSIAAKTEPEVEFWFKCGRASRNLASGMNKWAGNMIEELEDGEPDETEGG